LHGNDDQLETDYASNLYCDKFGHRLQMVTGNEVVTTYAYDKATQRITNIQAELPPVQTGYVFHNFQFGYDAVGNVPSLTNAAFAAGHEFHRRAGEQDLRLRRPLPHPTRWCVPTDDVSRLLRTTSASRTTRSTTSRTRPRARCADAGVPRAGQHVVHLRRSRRAQGEDPVVADAERLPDNIPIVTPLKK
jgi:hypothetical protein